jgi:hypothetical protein
MDYLERPREQKLRNAHKILVGKPEGRRPLGRFRHRYLCNVRMDLREIGFEVVKWINLAQNRDQWQALVNAVMKFRVS